MVRTRDMTAGNPVKLILGFAVPVLAGNLLQQLYNLIDSLIIGRILGVTALAAVSASGWLDWAVLSIPMGLAQGFSIQAAQCYGGRNYTALKRTVAQSYMRGTIVVCHAGNNLVLPFRPGHDGYIVAQSKNPATTGCRK